MNSAIDEQNGLKMQKWESISIVKNYFLVNPVDKQGDITGHNLSQVEHVMYKNE